MCPSLLRIKFKMEYSVIDLIYNFFIVLLITLLVLSVALKTKSSVSKIFFSCIYERISASMMESLVKEKRDLFKEMEEMTSADENLRANNVIRILEIGAGPGNNFEFYPKNSQLTLLEPNEYFMKSLMTKQSKCEHLKLSGVVISGAEDMSKIKDNSVDALVATYVLCSVNDIDKVLKEIHRVLTPGGKYFFLEHGYGKRSFWQKWFQICFEPLWSLYCCGCKLTNDTIVDIEKCQLFANVHSKTFPNPIQMSAILQIILGLSVYGTAEKPRLI